MAALLELELDGRVARRPESAARPAWLAGLAGRSRSLARRSAALLCGVSTSWLRQSGDDVVLSLHIQPGAKKTEVVLMKAGIIPEWPEDYKD